MREALRFGRSLKVHPTVLRFSRVAPTKRFPAKESSARRSLAPTEF